MHKVISAVLITLLPSAAFAGQWLTPDFAPGAEPTFKPVPLYWLTIAETPYVYRTELSVPDLANRATVAIRSAGYLYVYVDGKQVFAWAPRNADQRAGIRAQPADRNRAHLVDLSDVLTPGKHVLAISAPRDGFVLDGGVYLRMRRLATIASDSKWTVAKFAPTTILEDEPILKTAYTGPAAPVKAGEDFKASEDDLAKAFCAAFIDRGRRTLADIAWQAELMANKGIYIVDDTAHAWGGPQRLHPRAIATARKLVKLSADSRKELDALAADGCNSADDLAKRLPLMGDIRMSLNDLSQELSQTSNVCLLTDETLLSMLYMKDAGLWNENMKDGGTLLTRAEIEKRVGHALPRLNESRYDRLGWINHPGVTDSDIGRWGIRVNPISGPTTRRAGKTWLFSTDPKDEGEKELRYSIGYNIENQMARVDATRSWTADSRFANYRGIAWYRDRIDIPGEWTGHAIAISVPISGEARFWINDNEVKTARTENGRTIYELPEKAISFGGENFLAFKIKADGERRGLTGPLEVSRASPSGSLSESSASVDIFATPLSPCVILTPQGDTLRIHHPANAKLLLPTQGGFAPATSLTGKLPANWALLWLWPETQTSTIRPILLVFEHQPTAIASTGSTTSIRFAAAQSRIIAVRPWVQGKPPVNAESIGKTVDLWHRAALAIPINYLCITNISKKAEPFENVSIDHIPAGPVLSQRYIYDYLTIKDDWNTPPLKLAPLPALCTYAESSRFPGLKLADKLETLHDGGIFGTHRAAKDSDHVSYSYPIEPWPRLIGFTSFAFSGADVGVPGNKRELELIAYAGANSYRPQHNFADDPPPKGFYPPEEKRTRVQIMADYANALGINYMNNIDQTLGLDRKVVQNDYDNFMARVYRHYDKLVPQLAPRPFWAAAYDLINEPFDHQAAKYNPAMKELTRRIRAADKTHLLFIEPCQAWGAIQQLQLVEPTGDPLTIYSFHDYNFRLNKPDDRWPTATSDIRNIYQMWMPAFMFQIKNHVPMHCGEFGGFSLACADSKSEAILLNDFFRIFDQFGMSHHYYTGRELFVRNADGSLRPSNVVKTYRKYTSRADVNVQRWRPL